MLLNHDQPTSYPAESVPRTQRELMAAVATQRFHEDSEAVPFTLNALVRQNPYLFEPAQFVSSSDASVPSDEDLRRMTSVSVMAEAAMEQNAAIGALEDQARQSMQMAAAEQQMMYAAQEEAVEPRTLSAADNPLLATARADVDRALSDAENGNV